MLFWNKIW